MRDASVRAKTGKDWAGWFRVLDKAGAAKLEHAAIARLLSDKFEVPGWWCQMVTVEYERARGKRQPHQTTSGFSVAASKTVAASLSSVYQLATDPAKRQRWFPPGKFEPTSQTRNKYLRGAWNGTARLEFGFYEKGARKAQLAVAVTRLARKTEVETQRALWKQALGRLAGMAEGSGSGTGTGTGTATRRAKRPAARNVKKSAVRSASL